MSAVLSLYSDSMPDVTTSVLKSDCWILCLVKENGICAEVESIQQDSRMANIL
jgi:hypothetical protein